MRTKAERYVSTGAALLAIGLIGWEFGTGGRYVRLFWALVAVATTLLLSFVTEIVGRRLVASSPATQTRAPISELREQPAADGPAVGNELRDLESTVAFEDQAAQARSGSRFMLAFGIVVVVGVIVGGVAEIGRGDDLSDLSTGNGIFRASVIAAVFYLAGQMFRRASALERRADDLERAVVALRYGKDLSEDVTNVEVRDQLIADYLSFAPRSTQHP